MVFVHHIVQEKIPNYKQKKILDLSPCPGILFAIRDSPSIKKI